MDERLRKILILLLKGCEKTASWGIYNMQVHADSITFCVSAMKYAGRITIEPISDNCCMVTFEDGRCVKCDFGIVVTQIDLKIERTNSYAEDLSKWLQSNGCMLDLRKAHRSKRQIVPL